MTKYDAEWVRAEEEKRTFMAENGLYSEEEEHSSCGVGLVVSIDGKPTRSVVENGIAALKAIWHRGAVDADGKTGDGVCIVANVRRVSNHKINKQSSTQKGRIMSFLTIEDSTSSLDSVIIFPDARDKYQFILYEGANLMLCGKVDAKDSSFIIDKIHEI